MPRWLKITLIAASTFIVVGVAACAGLLFFIDHQGKKFRVKSLQSEAKTNLSGLFTAEKAFFGEYNTYSTDLVSVNWYPDGGVRYAYGFCNQYPDAEIPGISEHDPSRNHTLRPDVIQPAGSSSPRYFNKQQPPIVDPCALLQEVAPGEAFEVRPTSFRVFAIGNLDADATYDVWSVDEIKQLVNLRDDFRE